jgi:TATA-box binding protein (TBP) (component of TFIID and TFIIIB)
MFARTVTRKLAAAHRDRADALADIRRIDEALQHCARPSTFSISTMNIMVCLSISEVSLAKVKRLFEDEETKALADGCFRTSVTLQTDHEFNNCLIVKYHDGETNGRKKRTIAIKLFVNGTLQVSGCRTVDEALMNGQLMCRFLEGISDAETGCYTVVDFDVHMINCNFGLGAGRCLNLPRLHAAIQRQYKLFQRYDSANHAGLIITLMSNVSPNSSVTLMVFANANIIITGFKYWSELVQSYRTIMRILDECHSQVIMHTAECS